MTPAERNQYKTRADRVQEIVTQIEKLEAWRDVRVSALAVFVSGDDETLADRAWQLGIDTLIAQLEQQLADIDKPSAVGPKTFEVPMWPLGPATCIGGTITSDNLRDAHLKFPAVSGVSGANDYDSDPVVARMRDAYPVAEAAP